MCLSSSPHLPLSAAVDGRARPAAIFGLNQVGQLILDETGYAYDAAVGVHAGVNRVAIHQWFRFGLVPKNPVIKPEAGPFQKS